MRLLPSLCLVLLAACSHTPAPASAPKPVRDERWLDQPPRPSDPAYEQRVREWVLEQLGDVRSCDERTLGSGADDPAFTSSALYISPMLTYFPRNSTSSRIAAFEHCLLERLRAQPLPAPVNHYSAAWIRIHFRPGAGDVTPALSPLYGRRGLQVSLEVSGSAPDRITAQKLEPDTVPDPRRDVFAYLRDEMDPPSELSGEKVRFTQEALVNRVVGTMNVKCIVTWTGTVEDCRILDPLPYMEHQVLTALSSKRYSPVTVDGYALNVDYLFHIELKLPRQ